MGIRELILRLCMAGICGILIGLERELRAKEAGVRTHFLVCLGSAMLMIVSIFGFVDAVGVPGSRAADAARIAAQIVSGIGFIGAGTIMVHRQSITGLTTAAGLWAVAGIGMAIGSGMYALGAFATVLVLVGLEILQLIFRRARFHNSTFVYNTGSRTAITALENALGKNGWHVSSHEINVKGKNGSESYRVKLVLQRHTSLSDDDLLTLLKDFPDISPEKIDSSK